jgi:hypothetical protein
MSSFFQTPKGTAGYLNLVKPDTKFDPDGKYKAVITLTEEQAEPLKELAREEAQEALGKKAKTAKLPFVDNEDGTVTLTLKSKKKPKLFDAKGNPIAADVAEEMNPGAGSVIKVKGSFSGYDGFGGGVTCYLNEVQIIRLVEFGGGGFEAEDDEDGYVAPVAAPKKPKQDDGGAEAEQDEEELADIDF